ncbi:MAG: hypothetical protein P0111_14120 [Nitrospira sp.]|nr:hypothetical protein [Nitrospira sp.]
MTTTGRTGQTFSFSFDDERPAALNHFIDKAEQILAQGGDAYFLHGLPVHLSRRPFFQPGFTTAFNHQMIKFPLEPISKWVFRSELVMPAKAGIQNDLIRLDSRLRGNDDHRSHPIMNEI